MYQGKRKGIIIVIVLIILIIAVLGGIFVYAYTDLLKSNQTLFFKYMGQTLENLNYGENTQIATIEKLKEQMPYTIKGKLTSNENEQIALTVDAKVDSTNEKAYTKAQIINNGAEFFTIEYAKGNNIYALKSDEIVTAFLGIENSNLKVLAQKLGIVDTKLIPDELKSFDINEFYTISDEEKEHIKTTYITLINNSIPKECYTKEKNMAILKNGVTYTTNGYRLNLNKEQLKQIEVTLLQTLKEDSITLNLIATKAKLLGLDENYTQVNNLTKKIEAKIKEIQNKEVETEGGISIVNYVEGGKVITTEIILKNDTKFTIYEENKDTNKSYYLLIEKLNVTSEYNKIEIKLEEARNIYRNCYEFLYNSRR